MIFAFFIFIQSRTIITYPELENRNPDDVCASYQKDYVWSNTQPCYVEGTGCNYGTHSQEDIDATTRRVNFFRSLVGLDPCKTSTDSKKLNYVNQGSLVLDINNKFTHDLYDETLKCWSEAAQYGCRNSNLAMTTAKSYCSADTIPLYIDDSGTDSCGHRRWIFDPPLSEVVAGLAGSKSALLVMGGVNKTNKKIPTILAYPPPGPIPYNLVYNQWTFSRQDNRTTTDLHNMPKDTKVTVACNGNKVDVTPRLYNENTVMYPGAVIFNAGTLKNGTYCTVKISSDSLDTEWHYHVSAIKCVNGKAEDIPDEIEYDEPKKLSSGAIAGIVIAVLIVVAVAVYAGFIIYQKRH